MRKFSKFLQVKDFINRKNPWKKMKPWEVDNLCVIICHAEEASKINSYENNLCPTGLKRILHWSGKSVLPSHKSVDYRIFTTKTFIVNGTKNNFFHGYLKIPPWYLNSCKHVVSVQSAGCD